MCIKHQKNKEVEMKNFRKLNSWKAVAIVSFLVVPLLLGFSAERAAAKTKILIVSAGMGGTWYPLGGALAFVINKSIPGTVASVTTGGSISNLMNVESGRAQIGLSNSNTVADALKGVEDFKGKPVKNVRVLASLFTGYLHVGVSAGSEITSIDQIRGKVAAVPKKGNNAEKLFRVALDGYGMTYKDLKRVNHVSYTDGADLIRDGHADVIGVLGPFPFPALNDLAKAKGLKLLPIDQAHMQKMLQKYPGIFEETIPAGIYKGTDYPTRVIGAGTFLITGADMPEELVYQITKAFFANKKDFVAITKLMEGVTVQSAAKTHGTPLHPGAERFYREHK